MRSTRLLLVAAVVVALVGLTAWWSGAPEATDTSSLSSGIPSAGNTDDLSSTWFCAASSAATVGAATHVVVIANPSDEPASALLSGYNADGLLRSEPVEVPPSGPLTVNIGQLFGANDLSIMVESSAGDLMVEHRLLAETGADQVPCATSASERWYFPAQTTIIGTSAKLVLFNPFSADAGVDISAALSDGVRIPGEWSGIVVPAGTARVVDLGSLIQRRDIFSVAVDMRIGRVVAETVQTFDEAEYPDTWPADQPKANGVRMQLGVSEPAADWLFAEGFTGEGASERLVVFNPGEDSAAVIVQVTPYGAAEMPPEPFELDVPARRFATIDLSAETRIPGEGFHAIRLETSPDTPVVAGRVTQLSGEPAEPADAATLTRPNLPWGTAIGTGSTLAAIDWFVPQLLVGGDQQPMVFVHNPSAGIVVISASIVGGDSDGAALAEEVEVAAGDSVALPLTELDLAEGEVGVRVEASSPVVVERTITFAVQEDLSMGLAIPQPSGDGRFEPLSGD